MQALFDINASFRTAIGTGIAFRVHVNVRILRAVIRAYHHQRAAIEGAVAADEVHQPTDLRVRFELAGAIHQGGARGEMAAVLGGAVAQTAGALMGHLTRGRG